ncbi:MAG TPA: hypothetical protein DEP24_00820 [Mycobacterium sp.]|nr:hypothetical protein [Mycobacterium sp.]
MNTAADDRLDVDDGRTAEVERQLLGPFVPVAHGAEAHARRLTRRPDAAMRLDGFESGTGLSF